MKAKNIMWILLILLIAAACQTDNEVIEDEQEDIAAEEIDEKENPEQEKDASNETDSISQENESNESEKHEENQSDSEEDQTPNSKEPRYIMNDVWGFDPINEADEKVVLITIDDVPDKNGLEMAKTLNELEVPAIFFVNGHFIDTEEKQEELKQIHEMGFAIGNHTYDHQNLSEVSEEEQKDQIIRLNDEIEAVIGERPQFFRAPHGVNTDYVKELVKEEGMLLMNWSFGYDFQADYMEKEALTEIVTETELLGNGSNLLMHDREWTNAALEDIVLGLEDKGYGFIDPDEIQISE